MKPSVYELDELNVESTLGQRGLESDQVSIPVIDLSDFENRREAITQALWQAATEVGFFQVKNHGIALRDIQRAFLTSEQFFALSTAKKQAYPLKDGLNAGWEFKAQVRPSTGTPDQKESYQITLPHMAGLWPEPDEVAGFQSIMLDFERQAWRLGMAILSCFADKLGFERDFLRGCISRSLSIIRVHCGCCITCRWRYYRKGTITGAPAPTRISTA
ncbi:2-oxoglutarate and iron-dependent oxygenase domain-containing protein [Photobacterium sp. Hal280]|uniref:2-oxoglutarate and iron-dependent oxygenase domain-containing protein n=1 Tax=Photobacterium sp. Hal280 TaxID=3035163 RepID=UPI00301CED95